MSSWTSRITDHRIWDLMKNLGPLIDQAERIDDVEPDAVEALERLRAVLALCGKRLGGIEPLAMSPTSLEPIAAGFDQQKVAVEAFIADRNAAHLTDANRAADAVLAGLAQIPAISSSEELIDLIQAVTSYRLLLDERLRSETTARREAQSRINELTKSLEDVKNSSQTTLTELKAQLDAERQKISSLAAEQQKAFAEAQESRVNTLTKTLTDQQGQFSAAQESRSRDFTTAQTESQKRLDSVIADYTKRLTDQDGEFTKQRAAFVTTATEKLSLLNEDYDKKAKAILDDVNRHRSDIEKLVGVIGSLGVTSGYQTTANRARISMWIWQGITVTAMCGLIYFAYHAFLPSVQGDFKWESFAARVFLTITVGVLAAYAGAQADRFFHMEKSNRKLALELTAIDPFIALLPQAEQDKFKLEVGRRTFAQEEAIIATPEKSPATTLDLLNSDSVKQIISLVNAIKGK
jgi:chemotaxis protein histidine kinase CheA